MKRVELYSNRYICLYSDGEIGISDGVGYIDTMSKNEVDKLYNAIQKMKMIPHSDVKERREP